MKYVSAVLIFLFVINSIYGQTNTGIFEGKITSDSGEPLPYANVILKETNNGCASDINGKFKIISKPGLFTVEISYTGYEKVITKVQISSNKIIEENFALKSTSFNIGGIEVTAKSDFIPITPETKTVVSSGEIEHIQASSLYDVLKLTPGVETSNPTLNSTEKAQIRNGDALGTQIILDNIPITNNANMQIGIGQSTANSGIDLRAIPAENIKEVEIVRGIPSVRFGDLTDGLMIVKTKASPDPLRVKIKYNPQLYETNVGGGTKLGDWILNGNFNLALSRRDIRITGGGYTRIAAQLTLLKDVEDYSLKNILYFTRTFDDYKEVPGYALREAWYNKDINLKYSGEYTRSFSSLQKLSFLFSASYTKQNSYYQQLVSRDNIVITDLQEDNSIEGRIVFGSYLGQKYIKGDVWNIYSDLNYSLRLFTGNILHSFLFGINYRNDFNKGQGIIFDPLYPPSLTNTTPRLRTYDDIPAYPILSLYTEDKITGNFIKPFTLQFGVRYESYRPTGINFKGLLGRGDFIESYNGSFLNPRVALSFNLFENTQLRFGYGVTSKSPPMGMIFAQQKYFDVVDTVSVKNPSYPDSNFSIISTYIEPQANATLKGYTQRKYEASLDQQFDSFGFTVTGYVNKTNNMFDALSQPTAYFKKSFPDWPNQSTAFTKDTILDTYNQYANNGWENVSGIELILTTKRIPVINTVFRFDASYMYTEDGSENGYNISSSRYVPELGLDVMPIYNSIEYYYKDLLLNYRFEIQAKDLGIWLTLHLQQKLIEINGRRHYGDTLAIGYFSNTGEMVRIPSEKQADPLYTSIRKVVQPFELLEENKPNKWLVNLKVSKSLWKGAAISFYVNNFFYNQPLYKLARSSSASPNYERRNPDIFYGLEFSSSIW